MSEKFPEDLWLKQLAAEEQHEPAPQPTPSRVKSTIYSALIRKQQESGPLQTVSETKAAGSKLCCFEDLVRITPVGEKAEQFNCCSVCHARVLGERVEDAPIWWPHCPYVRFQNR
jgi:hypothetical protein